MSYGIDPHEAAPVPSPSGGSSGSDPDRCSTGGTGVDPIVPRCTAAGR